MAQDKFDRQLREYLDDHTISDVINALIDRCGNDHKSARANMAKLGDFVNPKTGDLKNVNMLMGLTHREQAKLAKVQRALLRANVDIKMAGK